MTRNVSVTDRNGVMRHPSLSGATGRSEWLESPVRPEPSHQGEQKPVSSPPVTRQPK